MSDESAQPALGGTPAPEDVAEPASAPASSPAAPATSQPPSLPPVDQGPAAQPTAVTVRGSRWRWWVAAIVTGLLVVGVALAVVVLSQPRTGTATAAWLPADTVAYAEVSADASTSQRDAVLQLLKRFPGFADQSNIGDKIDESFQRVFQQAGVDYRAEVKPWLGGTVTLGMRAPSPATGIGTGGTAAAGAPPAVILVASTNDAAASGFIVSQAQRAKATGASVASDSYKGVTITTITGLTIPATGSTPSRAIREPRALAVVDGRLVGGDPDLVRAVIDVRRSGSASLSGRATFRDAVGSLPSDRVGTLWVDIAGLYAGAASELQSMAPAAGLFAFSSDASLIGSLQAQGDGLVAEVRGRGTIPGAAILSPSPGASSAPHASRLAAAVPAGALVFVDLHDAGTRLQTVLNAARQAEPSAGQSIDQLNQALAALGTNVDQLSAAVGDAAFIATGVASPRVAVLIEVKDQALAARLINQVGALAALGGLGRVTTSDFQGVSIYHFVPSSSPSGLPATVAPAYALSGNVLVIGQDESVVQAVIGAQKGGPGIGGDADYTAATQRIGPQASGSVFVDLAALFSGPAVGSLSAEERAFLAPLHAAAAGIGAPGEHEWLGASRLFVLIR